MITRRSFVLALALLLVSCKSVGKGPPNSLAAATGNDGEYSGAYLASSEISKLRQEVEKRVDKKDDRKVVTITTQGGDWACSGWLNRSCKYTSKLMNNIELILGNNTVYRLGDTANNAQDIINDRGNKAMGLYVYVKGDMLFPHGDNRADGWWKCGLLIEKQNSCAFYYPDKK